VAPYFIRMENWHGGSSDWRGDSGPLHVIRGPRRNRLYHSFVEAGAQAGFELTYDYNGKKQEGFGAMEQTVWHGRRWSAANAYLRPALRTGRVAIVRGLALRVVTDGGRATGVEVARGGAKQVVAARREVILAASSINTPKLLLLSGIGPARHLAEHGIGVVADRPGVGGNLQDHLELYIQRRSLKPITLYRHYNYPEMLRIGAQWLLAKVGLGTSNQFETGAFVRSAAGVDYPDIQFHFLPLAVRYDGKAAVRGHGFQAHVGPMRSPSRGTVRLKSADPEAAPAIRFGYMAHEQDWADFRRCIRLTREIFAQPAFRPYAGEEIQPGAEVRSDDEFDGFVREQVESAYHPCGTARMGRRDDPLAVVDPECRVIGVEGLRVADSSVIPRITNGNLNAPSIMVGEKAADHVLGRAPLPRWGGEPWINPRWRESDR
jgi:choline dehydrogenase